MHSYASSSEDEETHFEVDLPQQVPTENDYVLGEVVHALQYYTPFLILFGVAGNSSAALVFRLSNLWKLSTSRYLTALAVTDSCFLAQLLVTWLDTVGWSDMFNRGGLCQASVYASYVCCNLSAWLVVAFTVERLVAVRFPLRRSSVCTVARATTAIQVLSVVALAVNLPVLRFAVAAPYCNLDSRYWRLADAFNLVDTLVSFTVPLAAIVVMNVTICADLFRMRRVRRALHAAADVYARQRCSADHYKVNGMLLTVSTVFVLLNLPAYSIRVMAYKVDSQADTVSERWITLQHVSMSLFNTNFGINFLLYCMSGENFRKALRMALGRRRPPPSPLPLCLSGTTANVRCGPLRHTLPSDRHSRSCRPERPLRTLSSLRLSPLPPGTLPLGLPPVRRRQILPADLVPVSEAIRMKLQADQARRAAFPNRHRMLPIPPAEPSRVMLAPLEIEELTPPPPLGFWNRVLSFLVSLCCCASRRPAPQVPVARAGYYYRPEREVAVMRGSPAPIRAARITGRVPQRQYVTPSYVQAQYAEGQYRGPRNAGYGAGGVY